MRQVIPPPRRLAIRIKNQNSSEPIIEKGQNRERRFRGFINLIVNSETDAKYPSSEICMGTSHPISSGLH